MTLGAGQAMTYIEKERQAQMVTEDHVNPALVPMVAIDAERNGDSLLDAAAVILTMAQYWRFIGPVIEDRRMTAKDRIAAATTPAEIEAAGSLTGASHHEQDPRQGHHRIWHRGASQEAGGPG